MSASRLLGLGALVLASTLAGACSTVTVGGGDGGGGGGDGGSGGGDGGSQADAMPPDPCSGDVALDDFYGCLIGAVCDIYDQCICAFSDNAHCLDAPFAFVSGLERPFMMDYLHDGVAAGVLTYDASRARSCLDFVRTATCGDLLGGNSQFDDLCQPFTGTVSAGGVCFADVDCAPRGSACTKSNSTGDVCSPGSCVAPAGLGADCSADHLCDPGAYCVQTMAGDYRCLAGNLGAPCQGSYQCDHGFYCDANSTCRPVVPDSGACTSDDQCAPGLQCVGDDLSGSGACHRVDMVDAPCDGSCAGCLFCNQPDTTQLGSCQMLPPAGQACTSQGRCADSFDVRCDDTNNMCVPGGEKGAPCTQNGGECRFGFFCTADVGMTPAGTCQDPQAAGSACTDSEQCSTGQCVDQDGTNSLCEAYGNCR